MTSVKHDAQLTASAESSGILNFARQSAAITHVELLKVMRDPTEVLARAVQPILWLVIFGEVFSRVRGIPTGSVSYIAFLTPGILAQSVLFAAIFYGVAVVWERDLGIVHKLLVSPAPRLALVFGKAVAAGFRGVIQAVVIYLTVLALRVHVRWNPLAIAGVHFRGDAGLGDLFHFLADYCLPGEIPRAFHGHRAIDDHAPVFRQ